MADRWIRHLPVIDGGQLVGVLSQRDLAGVLAGALNEPEALTALVESSELVREKRLCAAPDNHDMTGVCGFQDDTAQHPIVGLCILR